MKILRKIIAISLILAVTIAALTYDAFFSAPKRFTVRYETLSSIYIPEQMNDISVLYFSDLDYGAFMDSARLSRLVTAINGLSPDIVVFGGDLVADEVTVMDEAMKKEISTGLKRINAPLGKFAVMGDADRKDVTLTKRVEEALYDGEFELLNNRSISLRNQGSQAIVLVGVDNGVNGYADITTAFANVSRTSYAIAVCHTPDTAAQFPTDLTKYALAGHSHGGQAYWGFGALYTPPGATTYIRGKYTVNGAFTLDITNGTGTEIRDVRFLANAEIVLYRLEHRSITDTSN